MKKTIYSILKGTYLVNAGAYKKWRLILFFSSLALIMIASSHSADGKVHQIAKLQEDVKALRSEYVEKRAQLMGLKMESNLRDIMKDKDLFPSRTPPIKIVIASNTDKP
jgi:hypothetical protein